MTAATAIEIRRATADDAAVVALLNRHVQALHAAAWPAIFKPPADGDGRAAAFAALLADPDAAIFIAEVGGAPAGYVYARVERRPDNPFSYAGETLFVEHISVEPAYQRRGLGERLLGEAVALAREAGIPRVALAVWSFNDRARRFFAAQGFTAWQERLYLDTAMSWQSGVGSRK
ncbi:MAG TPA: GNAT family N-acetyltransferase [Thermomicrobiales bacterium]|nr:GNAT family N-acetyltransferase [Thermomicrobiales bacterium]